jgi:hypothetical protein
MARPAAEYRWRPREPLDVLNAIKRLVGLPATYCGRTLNKIRLFHAAFLSCPPMYRWSVRRLHNALELMSRQMQTSLGSE